MQKRKSSLRSIMEFALLVPNIINVICNAMKLIGHEARIAGRSVVIIMISSIVFAILLASSWICILGLVLVYLLSLQWNLMLCIFILLLLNILLLIILSIFIGKTKRNLLFPATTQQCKKLCCRVDE